MKSTGIVRKIDNLGRIVVPKELRRAFNIVEDETSLEVFVEGTDIVLRKYTPGCIMCGEARKCVEVDNVRICPDCLERFSQSMPEQISTKTGVIK